MSTTPTPVRVAIVGCGRIARIHGRYLSGLPNVRLVAVCDAAPNAAAVFATELSMTSSFVDVSEMLEKVRPDAVHVVTPPSTHAEVAIAALEAGAHVLVEKPMAIDAGEAGRMLAAAAKARRTLCVDHNRWFDPVVQRAVRLWQGGGLGTLVGVDVFQGAGAEIPAGTGAPPAGWRATLPGGFMHDLAPHPAYLLRNAAGCISKLQVEGVRANGMLQEVRALGHGERCLGTMTISMQAQPFTNFLRLVGTKATAEVNLNNMTLIVRRPRRVPKLVGKVLPNLEEAAQLVTATVRNAFEYATGRQRFYPGMGVLIERFYRHLTAGTPAPTTPEEGLEVVEILDAIWRSGAAEKLHATA